MILIVDDKSENIYSLKQLLESKKFEVDTALSGEEALKKVLKNDYALLILDVQMPGMDGFEVAENMAGHSKSKDIPIIFLSAVNTDKTFITRGYESGAIDYVTKPVDPDVLLLKVKTFIRLYEQNRKLSSVQKSLLEEIEFRKEAERKKDEFISIASHELKTPLTSVKAYTQLLERSLKNNTLDLSNTYLKKSKIQLTKLENLIADLLDISKIESGELKLTKDHFKLESLLCSVIDIIKQTHEGVEIEREGDLLNLTIFADEIRIEQVIINYLTNAIKYSPEAQKIILKTSLEGEALKVTIQDFGIGIPKEKINNIFQKFYRVEESSLRFQGLGIGLYICSEIIRQHNGAVGVNSQLGKGSSFYFTLPLN